MESASESGSQGHSRVESELYFLIAKFLEFGPCKKTAEVLKREIEANGLLPKRIDWLGEQHQRDFENLNSLYGHIAPKHLLKVCQRVGPLLEKSVAPSVCGVKSLLGAGRLSLLRTEDDVKFTKWPGVIHVATRHSRPLCPPSNLANPPNIINVLRGRELSGTVRYDHAVPWKTYSAKFTMHSRAVVHLSSVYCVAFDRAGRYIFTGADDCLIKVWCVMDGRLLATFRGHSGEITDIAVNYENTILASGSCDKLIRIWCLRTTTPLAVLTGHTGMITSVQFSPLVRGNTRYLASTGGDGCVCFWEFNVSNYKFNPKPAKFIERSRAGAQMLCSSFSPGGVFLATGSTDHVIRVFCYLGMVPEKICELESHMDRVDSIQYSHRSDRFVSGSRDGTARIWRFDRQEWKNLVLDMATRLTKVPLGEEKNVSKLKVTMVAWSLDDRFVITAVNDLSLKVWDSSTGELRQVLKGHEDEVFVLETHTIDPRILLSAGHDGKIIMWDLISGKLVNTFKNSIAGQGFGAVFDCKFSCNGQNLAATDSHGHLLIFGFGSSEKYKKIPDEIFFHTDYRPLIRDANNYVLDEQTQQPPHLMPPPFLVDVDGLPHPPKYQRLVPGRENCKDSQLLPQIGVAINGNREVIDDQPLNIPVIEEEEEEPPLPGEGGQVVLDAAIRLLQEQQDRRLGGPSREPLRSISIDGAGSNRMRRRGGEGVRQAEGNVPVSHRATNSEVQALKKRVLIRAMDPAVYKSIQQWRKSATEEEMKKYIHERKRKPLPLARTDSSDSGSHMRTRRNKKNRHKHSYGTRGNNEETGVNRLQTRALYDTEVEDSNSDTIIQTDNEVEQLENWSSAHSVGGESSDYSDWIADTGLSLQPPKRSQRTRKRRKMSSSEAETDLEGDGDGDVPVASTARKKPPPRKKEKKKIIKKNVPHLEAYNEVPEAFIPPIWLTDTVPRKAPYVPQMGDEVMYFRQGHEAYVQAVKKRNVYNLDPNRNQPWHKMPNLREHELVKIIGIKYEVKPPRLCCLKLGFMDPSSGALTGLSFNIKYHDMPDVIDFLVLRQMYDGAMRRNWKASDRFCSLIDDAWWLGTIENQEPFQSEFTDSLFQCFRVAWDNGEFERMSPWDLEPIYKRRVPKDKGGCVPVTPAELKQLLYAPKANEWPACGRDAECERIIHGLETVMQLSRAEPFIAPVDLSAYPVYAIVVEYPIDLNTIKERLTNRFYRRINALQFDVRHIESNSNKFNEAGTDINKSARLITDVCLKFIEDSNCDDPMIIYNQRVKDFDLEGGSSSDSDSDKEDGDYHSPSRRHSRHDSAPDSNTWGRDCLRLLDTMVENDDSLPFRLPVSTQAHPDYAEIIDHPMDLSKVRTKLENDRYVGPGDFAKDVRLIFNNSKSYNTNKKSKVYSMTLRLSAFFDDRIRRINSDWKSALRFEKTGRKRGFRSRKPLSPLAAQTSRSFPIGPSTSSTAGPSSSSHDRTSRSAKSLANPPSKRRRVASEERRPTSSDQETEEDVNVEADSPRRKAARSNKGKQPMINGHSKAGRYQVRKISRAAAPTKSFAEASGSSTEEEEEDTVAKSTGTRTRTVVVNKADENCDDEEEGPSGSGSGSDESSNDDKDSSSSTSESESEEDKTSRQLRGRAERKPVQRHIVSHDTGRRSRNTRNRGQRTFNYDEDSDYDGFDDMEASSQPSISSRGRVRKITPRARASLGMS